MNRAKKHHPLVDVKEPNLLEDTYPYSLPPLIRFEGPVIENIDGKAVDFDFRVVKERNIFISDTTFRDGQQARPPYTIDQMVHIYDLMSRLGGNSIFCEIVLANMTKYTFPELDFLREHYNF